MGQFKGIKRCTLDIYKYLKDHDLLDADTLYVVPGTDPLGISTVNNYSELPTPSADVEGVTFCVLNDYLTPADTGYQTQGLYTCFKEGLNYIWKKSGGSDIPTVTSFTNLPSAINGSVAVCKRDSIVDGIVRPAGLYVVIEKETNTSGVYVKEWKYSGDNGIYTINSLNSSLLNGYNLGKLFYSIEDNDFYRVNYSMAWNLDQPYYNYSNTMTTDAYNNGDYIFYTVNELNELCKYQYNEMMGKWSVSMDITQGYTFLSSGETFNDYLSIDNLGKIYINYERNRIKQVGNPVYIWSAITPYIYSGSIDSSGVVTRGNKISDFKGIIVLDNTSITPTSIPEGYSLEIAEA